jgi:adenosine kinase
MQLVDAAAVGKLYADMGPAVEISGGSGANIVGVARSAAGRLHRQDRRRPVRPIFGHDIRTAGVTFTTPAAAKEPAHRPLPGAGDAGRPAHHEHVPVSPQLGGGEVDAELIASAHQYLRAICSTSPRPRPLRQARR